MTFRPLLSGKAPDDLRQLQFPVYVSPKLNGIRCLITEDGPVTRTLKPIPNADLRRRLSLLPVGLDGELIAGRITGADVWNRTSSTVMSEDGDASDVTYHVFDDFLHPGTFAARGAAVIDRLSHCHPDACTALPVQQHWCTDPDHVSSLENHYVKFGFEGIMIRTASGPYKFGRSTVREGYLLKLKRFHDAEAFIVDAVERMHNENESKINALGLSERSTRKDNKVPTGTLGAFVCQACFPGDRGAVQFEVGTGFTEAQRRKLWQQHISGATDQGSCGLVGRIIKFKYQDFTPAGKPLFPVFLGFRDERDM